MKAGILVESLGVSQRSIQIIKEINKVKNLDEYWDIILFYMTYDRLPVSPSFAMMSSVEAYGFTGPLISTSIKTTKVALNCLKASSIYFYVFDLEWSQATYDVDYLLDVYANPKVNLIARSKSHADIIQNSWNRPVVTIENFNYEEITELIK